MIETMTNGEMVPQKKQTAAEMREAERRKRSNIDRMILKNARKSHLEISELTGVPVDEVATRLDALLRSRDHLTDRQEERLLLIEMGDLIDSMIVRMDGAKEENYADIANVTLRGYEAIGKRFDARRKLTELDISEITRAQGEMFLAIVLEANNRMATRLEELHPDSEWDIRSEMEEALAVALPEARDEVNRRVRE
jgi:hypothetical protein